MRHQRGLIRAQLGSAGWSRFRGSRYSAEVKGETLISSPVRGTAAMQEANFVADSLLEGAVTSEPVSGNRSIPGVFWTIISRF